MRSFEFELAIPAEEIRRIYAGQARYLLVEDQQGLKLQLPAANFRQFVNRSGLHGRFQVTINDDNRIVELRRLRPAG